MEDFSKNINGSRRENVPTWILHGEPQGAASLENEIKGPVDYWNLVRRRKLLVTAMVFLGAAAGTLVTLRQVPLYRARTSLEIQNGGEVTVHTGIEGNVIPSISETTMMSYLQTQVVILESRSFRKRVTAKLAEQKPHAFYTMDSLSGWQQVFGIDATNPPDRKIQTGFPPLEIEVRTVPNTRIIEIAVDSPDAKFSAEFANGMANEFLGYNLEARWDAAKRTTAWLTTQMESFKTALKESEDRLQAYRRQAGLIKNDKQEGSLEQDKLKDLQQQLARAEEARIGIQIAHEMSLTTPPDSLPGVADSPRLEEHQKRLTELRGQLAELSSDLTPAHPKVMRVQAQIALVEDAIRADSGSVLTKLANEFKQAQLREKALSKTYAGQFGVVSDETSKMVNYNLLKREVDTNRNLYDTLLAKMKEAGISAASSSTDRRVVDVATPPSKPYKPNIYLNTVGGLMVGFLFSVGIVVLRERMDQTFKAPGETTIHLQLPELGVIPERKLVSPRTLSLKRIGRTPRSGAAKGPASPTELITWKDGHSVVAESFRNVMASIRASEKGETARALLVTSAVSSDGKSTTVANLGIALAEIGQRVLLIDGDVREPRLHSIFDLPNTHGLSDLLAEPGSISSIPLAGFIHATQVNGLTVLPSGPRPVSVSKLLYSQSAGQLLRRLRREYDVVLIDTPPILAMSDARVLGRLADGTILVVRAGKTPRDLALAARQRLTDDGIPLLGTILVAWDGQSRTRYGMDKYYSYSYADSAPAVVNGASFPDSSKPDSERS